jgi:hypothetical protein
MGSDLVFGAITQVSNRFLLVQVLAKATRGFHRPGTRIQDTTNDLLAHFCYANPIADEDTVRTSAIVPWRRRRPQPVITRKSKSLTVPAVRESPQSRSEAYGT